MTDEERFKFVQQIHDAFTPTAPIQSRDLFAGRRVQVDKVVRAVLQRGEHAILYGERGVGKTSLVNTLFDLLVYMGRSDYQVARVQCADGMDFKSMWRAVFRKLRTTVDGEEVYLDQTFEALGEELNSEGILHLFNLMDNPSIVIIDELDRVGGDKTTQIALADTIKTLSDNSVPATLILVGVADNVDELVTEHLSTMRALKQVPMPRMSIPELLEIVDKGIKHCVGLGKDSTRRLAIDPTVRERTAELSLGLPEYTHRLAQEAALHVVNEGRRYIIMPDLEFAIRESVDNQLETSFSAYKLAVEAPRGTLFKPVLLACALAKKDEHGFFYAKDIVQPLRLIESSTQNSVDQKTKRRKHELEIPAFARHLKQFSNAERGPVLQNKKRQYRFLRPSMEPYVILRGLSDGLISEAKLSRPSKAVSNEPGQLSLLSSYVGPEIEI